MARCIRATTAESTRLSREVENKRPRNGVKRKETKTLASNSELMNYRSTRSRSRVATLVNSKSNPAKDDSKTESQESDKEVGKVNSNSITPESHVEQRVYHPHKYRNGFGIRYAYVMSGEGKRMIAETIDVQAIASHAFRKFNDKSRKKPKYETVTHDTTLYKLARPSDALRICYHITGTDVSFLRAGKGRQLELIFTCRLCSYAGLSHTQFLSTSLQGALKAHIQEHGFSFEDSGIVSKLQRSQFYQSILYRLAMSKLLVNKSPMLTGLAVDYFTINSEYGTDSEFGASRAGSFLCSTFDGHLIDTDADLRPTLLGGGCPLENVPDLLKPHMEFCSGFVSAVGLLGI